MADEFTNDILNPASGDNEPALSIEPQEEHAEVARVELRDAEVPAEVVGTRGATQPRETADGRPMEVTDIEMTEVAVPTTCKEVVFFGESITTMRDNPGRRFRIRIRQPSAEARAARPGGLRPVGYVIEVLPDDRKKTTVKK